MKPFRLLALLLTLAASAPAAAKPAANPKPFVIPELRSWTGARCAFVPTADTRIVHPADAPELARIARQFAADYRTLFGTELAVAAGRGAAGDIVLALAPDPALGEEGYAIRIGDRVRLTAPAPAGLYWGTRTLLQIAEQSPDRRIPAGEIRDWPDYAVRGFMLDCGRKFIPMEMLRDYVRILAYYKMNTLQIHLNDNGFPQYFGNDWNDTYAAFRLESDTFPGLTARDGSYSKREFVDLQELAEERFVEIIPEIDAPAHTLAFAHYKPEIGSKKYGMDHLDLAAPETYEFLDALLQEYLGGEEPVFRGRYMHIGTDEYSNAEPQVVEQFRAFTDRYIALVQRYGKQACVWGSITHARGKTPIRTEEVVMSAWSNDYAAPKDIVEAGYKFISIPDGYLYIVPAAGYYRDYLDCADLYAHWTPAVVGGAVFEERDPSILGGMFAVWNDHVGNGVSVGDIHHRFFPALQTLAGKMWTASGTSLPYADFDRLRTELSEAPGVNRLGRIGSGKGLVYAQEEVLPNSRLPHRQIGYGYRVCFDIEGAAEPRGTVLFASPDAVFYLADPIRGLMGFARDGYLSTFDYVVRPGEKVRIAVSGDNLATRLEVDGRLVQTLDMQTLWFDGGKSRMNYLRTLLFPLEQAGDFRSRITRLEVYAE